MSVVSSELKVSSRQGDEAPRLEVHKLLRLDPSNPDRLVSRENSRLEYKETFNWSNRAKYAKTMAAFANHIGGFIVFGIKDSPHDLVGVNADRFDGLDPSQVAGYLNSAFAPEIEWEAFRIEIAGIQLGVLAVRPAVARPVMCIKNDGSELREADIYYRYRGRSERIRYPELQHLLVASQERERDAWLKHLSKVARIGVENVGVVDLVDGELSGPGGRLIVSSELLEKVQFVRDGHFTERHDDGAPTLRLVGEVEVVAPGSLSPVKTIVRPLAIGEKELVRGFLRQEHPPAPTEYVKQACREISRYMPVYHFARTAGLGLNALRDRVVCESARRNGLLDRIDGATVVPVGSLDSGSPSSNERRRILKLLQAGNTDGLRRANRTRLLEAVTHFQPPNPPIELLKLLVDLMEEGFNKLNSLERSLYRKAVACLDEALNRPACAQRDVRQTAS